VRGPVRLLLRGCLRRINDIDLNELSQHIDTARVERELTWAEISRQVGVATSTIRRFATVSDAEADGVLSLIGWLGVAPERFIINSNVDGSPLPDARDGVIRVDMARIAEAESRRTTRVGSRTTIQRLVAAAQGSGTSVSSLTKWSPV
jgi:hypothetical protein